MEVSDLKKFDEHCGVLLLNMGGPESLDQVKPYLSELFSDPYLVRLPLGKFYQRRLARLISARRANKARERYAAIGGKSPVNAATESLASRLSQILAAEVSFAMRYTRPKAADALEVLRARGITRLVVIPLYPQYSIATSGSSLVDFKAQNKNSFSYTVVENHCDHPGFINALLDLLSKALEQTGRTLHTHILFAGHSIPESYTRKGDPYISQVKKTIEALSGKVPAGFTFSAAFQSRMGPFKWHGPSLEQELEKIRAEHIEQLVVQPVSFVCENLETLYDLDIEFRKKCQAAGIKKFVRVPCPAQSELYLGALGELALSAARQGKWEGLDA